MVGWLKKKREEKSRGERKVVSRVQIHKMKLNHADMDAVERGDVKILTE